MSKHQCVPTVCAKRNGQQNSKTSSSFFHFIQPSTVEKLYIRTYLRSISTPPFPFPTPPPSPQRAIPPIFALFRSFPRHSKTSCMLRGLICLRCQLGMNCYVDQVPVRTIGSGTKYDGRIWYECLSSIRSVNGKPAVHLKQLMLQEGDKVTEKLVSTASREFAAHWKTFSAQT